MNVCAGVVGAVALPVVGVGVGVTQIVRGVANTPEAIREQQKGKTWDQVRPTSHVRAQSSACAGLEAHQYACRPTKTTQTVYSSLQASPCS